MNKFFVIAFFALILLIGGVSVQSEIRQSQRHDLFKKFQALSIKEQQLNTEQRRTAILKLIAEAKSLKRPILNISFSRSSADYCAVQLTRDGSETICPGEFETVLSKFSFGAAWRCYFDVYNDLDCFFEGETE